MWCVFSKHGYLLGSFHKVEDAILAMARWRDAYDFRFCEVDLSR
jgi:hypothetical protein